MKKFILGAFFATVIFAISFLQAFAVPIDSVEVKNGVTIIKGQLPQIGAGQLVSIEVIKPDKTIEDIDYTNPQTGNDILCHLEQTQTDVDGKYSINFVMEGESGTYLARVSWYSLDTAEVKSFHFFSQNDILKLVVDINSCTDALQARSLIESNSQMLALDLISYNSLTEKSKNLIATAIFKHSDFAMIDSIADYFDIAVIVQKINETVDYTAYKSLIEQNRVLFALDNAKIYNRFTTTMDSQAVSRMQNKIVSKNIYDPQLYKIAFEDLVIATALETVNGWVEVYPIISMHNDILKLDFTGYNSLKEKSVVDKQLVGKSFETREQIADAFNKAVEKAKAEELAQGNINSSGGGNSGGGSVGVTSTINIEQPLATQQTKQDDQQFEDLDTVPWAIEGIRWLAFKGIINGKGDGLFKPNDPITREEFTKMLVGAINSVDESATAEFNDVDKTHWSYKYIASANKIGLVNGNSDGTFGLGSNITRQDMTVLVYRMATIKNIELTNKFPSMLFADGNEIADYATKAITVMQQAAIVGGVGNGKFAPNEIATRAQAAKIVYLLLGGKV